MRKKIGLKNNKRTFNEGYKEFINYCRVRNLRPATIKHYEDIINYTWYKFFDENEHVDEITARTIERFIIFCKNKGQKDVTINTNLRGMRTILYYFMKLGYMNEFKISEIEQDKDIIETYTTEELEILLKKPEIKKVPFYEYRNWVACNVLLGTGCRIATLVNIKVADIDLENGILTYRHTKNRSQQKVPISTTLQLVLKEYIGYVGTEGYLIQSVYGEKLKPNSISNSLRYYNRHRGIEKTGCHRWRHTFSKLMILSGGDAFRLQRMLGHRDMKMVKNYVNMFVEDLKEDFDSTNPLESFQKKKREYKRI